MSTTINKINNKLKERSLKDGYVAIDTRFGWEYNAYYYDTEPVLHTNPDVYTITDGCEYLFCLTDEEFNEINKQRVFIVENYEIVVESVITKLNNLLKYCYLFTGYLAININGDNYNVRWYSEQPKLKTLTNVYSSPTGTNMFLTRITAAEFKELNYRRLYKIVDGKAITITECTQEDVFNLLLTRLNIIEQNTQRLTNGYLFIDNIFMQIKNKNYYKAWAICEDRVIYLTFINEAELKVLDGNLFVIKDGRFITPGLKVDFPQASETILYQLAKEAFAPKQELFKVISEPFTDHPYIYGLFTEENVQQMIALLNNDQYNKVIVVQLVDCRLIVDKHYKVMFQIRPD